MDASRLLVVRFSSGSGLLLWKTLLEDVLLEDVVASDASAEDFLEDEIS